jgi:hypothetical protein
VNVSLTVLRRGDIVRNNLVTGADALFIEQYVVGLQPGATAQQLFVGDVVPANISNGVTGGDALYIEQLQVGLQTQQP